jgi:hypothetical protein
MRPAVFTVKQSGKALPQQGEPSKLQLHFGRLYVENIFGFALVKNENFRWWAGPLIRVGFYSGESDTFDVKYGELGLGAVTGLNFRAGATIIAPSVGIRFNSFGGTIDDGYWEEDFTGHTSTAFANVALLF